MRFYYYLIIVNMLANIVAYVPRILLENPLDGTVTAIVLSIPLGFLFLYKFTSDLSHFPSQGIPEILRDYTPTWFRVPIIWLMVIIWYIAGLITLLAFSHVTLTYINPAMNPMLVALIFIVTSGYAAMLKTKKVLYAIEILLFVNVPLIAIIVVKAYVNEYFSWDSAFIPLTHFVEPPRFLALSASMFTLIGFANMVIFNRAFSKLNFKWMWTLPFFFAGNLFTTFFIPIGFSGIDSIDQMVYPWFSATDAMNIEFGFVERAIYIFILLYLSISIISITIHWHVAIELTKGVTPKVTFKGKDVVPFICLTIFAIITFICKELFTEYHLYQLAKGWLVCIIPFLAILILILHIIVRRKVNG